MSVLLKTLLHSHSATWCASQVDKQRQRLIKMNLLLMRSHEVQTHKHQIGVRLSLQFREKQVLWCNRLDY